MRRTALNRMWTVIFTLLLCGASVASLPRNVWADHYPGDPAPPPGPPSPGGGDPDWPDGAARTPKPSPGRGASQPSARRAVANARQDAFSVWMFKVRMAFATGFRFFLRF